MNVISENINSSKFDHFHRGIMYMPGSLITRFECYDKDGNIYKCMNIIYSKHKFDANPSMVFRAKVELVCPKLLINKLINFPPVFRSFDINNDEETIGSYMYNYGKSNGISVIDITDTKLTMTLYTMGQFRSFGCYYLWFFH